MKSAKLPRPNQAKKIPKSFPMWEHTLEKPLFCNLPLRHQVAYLNQLVCRACFIQRMDCAEEYSNLTDQSFSQDDRWDLNPIHYLLFKTELNHHTTNNYCMSFSNRLSQRRTSLITDVENELSELHHEWIKMNDFLEDNYSFRN